MSSFIFPLLITAALQLTSTVDGGRSEYRRYMNGFASSYAFNRNDHRNPPEVAKFLSENQTFSVEIGNEVTFPCNVRKKNEEYKMIFKFIPTEGDDRIIFAGDIKVTHFPRLQKKDSSFTLKNIHKNDAGSYICRFETNPVMQLIHKLDVQYPAEVHRVGPKYQTVTKSSKVTLQCLADGNPPPAVTWSREEGPLTAGAFKIEGHSITLNSVNLTQEGKYICRASNGIGNPDTSSITLHVEYLPEITTKQSIVFSKGRVEAHILCIVHGRPMPDVKWLRGDALVSSDKHVMTHDGSSRHTLTITHVSEDDFGEYTCRARNMHGEVSRTLIVTGLPRKPRIVSSPAGVEETSYNLIFETESFASIMQYRLRYRKAPLDIGKRENTPWVDFLYSPMEVNLIRRGSPSGSGVFRLTHFIQDLEQSEDYEATVRVENKYGWSNESDIFLFYTRKKISLGLSTSGSEMMKVYLETLIASPILAILFRMMYI